MMKKILSVISALALAFVFSVFPFAFTTESGNSYVTDDADLLSDTQEEALLEKIEHIHNTYNFDIVFHTTMSTDGQYIVDYADDYYDYNGYGYGENYDGLLFMLNMNNNEVGNREYYTSTCGSGIEIFGDYAVSDDFGFIYAQIFGYLVSGDYYNAFDTFLYYAEDFLIQAQNGNPYDYSNPHPHDSYNETTEDYYYNSDYDYDYDYSYDYDYNHSYTPSGNNGFFGRRVGEIIKYEVIALIVAFVVAYLIMRGVRSSMNSARVKKEAANYIVPNSLNITQSHTRFTHSHVTTVRKPQNTNNNHHGGGRTGGGFSGGGTHVGSSGRSHGGGGGKF